MKTEQTTGRYGNDWRGYGQTERNDRRYDYWLPMARIELCSGPGFDWGKIKLESI